MYVAEEEVLETDFKWKKEDIDLLVEGLGEKFDDEKLKLFYQAGTPGMVIDHGHDSLSKLKSMAWKKEAEWKSLAESDTNKGI